MSIGERVKMLRTGKGIKQTELAKILNSSSAVLSAIEVDKNAPSIEILNALSNFFNVSTDYILNGKEEPNTISDDEQEVIKLYREDGQIRAALKTTIEFKKKVLEITRNTNYTQHNLLFSQYSRVEN